MFRASPQFFYSLQKLSLNLTLSCAKSSAQSRFVILSATPDPRFDWHRLSSLGAILGTAWKGCAAQKRDSSPRRSLRMTEIGIFCRGLVYG
jgi:hypothetical protein